MLMTPDPTSNAPAHWYISTPFPCILDVTVRCEGDCALCDFYDDHKTVHNAICRAVLFPIPVSTHIVPLRQLFFKGAKQKLAETVEFVPMRSSICPFQSMYRFTTSVLPDLRMVLFQIS